MSGTKIESVSQALLTPAGLSNQMLMQVLEGVLRPGIDSADIYLQSSQSERWALEDGVVKDGSFAANRGFGLRAISGEKSGFAYSDAIDKDLIEHAATSASSIVKSLGADSKHIAPASVESLALYTAANPLLSLDDAAKISLLENMDKLARAKDPRVKKVFISLSGEHDNILVAHSSGTVAGDVRPMVHLRIEVIVEQNGRTERGSYAGGGRYDYLYFNDDLVNFFVSEAVRRALLNLESESAPAGNFPVVLGAGWPAVLLHEAIGHGLEGDSCRKGTSVFANLMGEQIASDICTVVDDGTLPGHRGSLTVDDEGVPTECTTLIENGKLVSYMQDRLSAKLTGAKLTGNGRRESYAHQPMVRMTNTYMQPGKSTKEEIIASMQKGLLALDFSGGQVDTTSGQFVFTTSEAYWVEDGKIAYPVKQATLIGDGASVLKGISMVGDDLKMDSGIGTCGKAGQAVPVTVGQPTVKVDNLTVGGASV